MEQARLLIAIVLSALIFLVWQFFFVDKEATRQAAKPVEQPIVQEKQASEVPSAPLQVETAGEDTPAAPDSKIAAPDRIARTIVVDTSLYRAQLSEKGAGFTSFVLKKYREEVAKDSPLKELLPREDGTETVIIGFSGNDGLAGSENAVYSASTPVEHMTIGESSQELTYSWKSANGIVVEKTYRFVPDSYLIGFDVTIKNGTDIALENKSFIALKGAVPAVKGRYGFEGPAALINGKLEEIAIKDIPEKGIHTGDVKWMAVEDRYFLMSLIPEDVEAGTVSLHLEGNGALIEAQYLGPDGAIPSGAQRTEHYSLFFGPKSMKVLNAAGHDLGKALNFGFFDFIAKPFVWLMNRLYSVIPNYGVAIIILTILIKIILWPLGSKSYKSMSEMKKIQPLMKDIREKYKNDKKRMNEEVMGLYRTYKINPLGGCLPMVVQLPVFFALYRMLYQAIELRHAPFFLWINDLSAPDRLGRLPVDHIPMMQPPYGIPVLTIIMGATMLLQQKMSPPMGDPTQAKMMMFMPIIFTVIFINFSAGLVLYWMVNNILSISQQYYIQKKFS